MKAFVEYEFAKLKYKFNLFEREAFWVQKIYPGLAPTIPSPPIHNLSRLSDLDLENKSEKNNSVLNEAA